MKISDHNPSIKIIEIKLFVAYEKIISFFIYLSHCTTKIYKVYVSSMCLSKCNSL